MSRWGRVRPFVPGTARVVLAGGAAAGLVWLGMTHPVSVDLVAVAGNEPAPVSGTSLATHIDAMCPGPELTGIDGVPDVETRGTVAAATGPAALLPEPATGAGTARLLAGTKELDSLDSDRPGDLSAKLPRQGPVTLRATGALAPAVATTQEWLTSDEQTRGLATTPCLPAGSDLWLVAGGDGPGRLERLVLLNPGGNPVTADVSVLGAAGEVGESRTETVAAGGRATLLLDAWAGDEKQPVVHVVADGGGLQAALSDTWLVGSTPRGTETVVPTDHAATVQVVPGAVLDGGGTLRVAVPGDEQAVIKVSVLGKDGLVPTSGTSVLSVAAGATGELELPAVSDGPHAVVVTGDVPVVASVVTDAGNGTDPGDIAWSSSAPLVRDVAGAALPATKGVERTLQLVSTEGSGAVTVYTVADGRAGTRKVRLSDDHTASVDVGDATAVWVQRTGGPGELRGAVVSTKGSGDDALVSVMPLEPSAVTSPVSRAFPLP